MSEFPGLDDKVLTAWTALMASGLTTTGTIFNRTEDIERARQALDFILGTQRRADGRLQHVYHESTGPRIDGMLDDYGSTIAACLDFYQATFETRYALAAAELAEQAITEFYDQAHGTFWFQRMRKPCFEQERRQRRSVGQRPNGAQPLPTILPFQSVDWRIMSDRMLAGASSSDYWQARRGAGLYARVASKSSQPEQQSIAAAAAANRLPAPVLYAGGTDEALPAWTTANSRTEYLRTGRANYGHVCEEALICCIILMD